jgi:hypothetical protein
MNPAMGKWLIVAGLILVAAGLVMVFKIQIPWIGRLPGDIFIKRDNFSFYFPLTTSVIVSAVLSLLFYLFRK